MSRFGLPQNQLIKFAGRMAYLVVKQSNSVLQQKTLWLSEKNNFNNDMFKYYYTIVDCICVFFFTLKYPCKIQLKTKFGYLVNLDIVKSNQNPTLIIFGNLGFFPVGRSSTWGLFMQTIPNFHKINSPLYIFHSMYIAIYFCFFLKGSRLLVSRLSLLSINKKITRTKLD